MFQLAAVLFLGSAHGALLAVFAALAAGLLFGTVAQTFSGTNAGPLDTLLGTFGPTVDAALFGLTAHAASGAIALNERISVITVAGVGAMTLATPVAGSPANGGNDGQQIRVIDQSGHAHTITTAANTINGNKHILTSAGNVGDDVVLTAYNGVWYVSPTTTAWVLS